MSINPEQTGNTPPTSELYGFVGSDGAPRVDEVFRTPGDSFRFGPLVRGIALDPVAYDVGCVAVHLEQPTGGKRILFYADGANMTSREAGQSATQLVDMTETDVYDPDLDIVIGQEWRSPLGDSGIVKTVAIPRTKQHPSDEVKMQEGKQSSTEVGKAEIRRLLAAATHAP